MQPVSRTRLGGVWDTVERKFTDDKTNPIVWYAGPRQADILLRRDDEKTRTLLYSAEGGGKTFLMAQWILIQILRLAEDGEFGAGGATAPTHERLETLVTALGKLVPIDTPFQPKAGAWATRYSHEREIRFVTGHTLQFRSTRKQSYATGSPIQGFTWKFSGDDELQDTVENGADPDIEARLRGAKTSRRMCTATAKDSPQWRSVRDEKLTSQDWTIERLRFDETPFVWPDHWDRMRRNMSPREWQRRGLALDVAPENVLYTSWQRERNLRPAPWQHESSRELLQKYGPNFILLGGHDPGQRQDVTILLKGFKVPGVRRHQWWVIDEITTKQSTTDEHVRTLLYRLRERWGSNLLSHRGALDYENPGVHLRADPYGDTNTKPHKTVYQTFREAGIDIRSAAYKHGKAESATIPKEARIEMLNRLLYNAAGESFLFVDCDDRRQPCAPRLVESLELSARNAAGEAEAGPKDETDLSHWTAALGFALWPLERDVSLSASISARNSR